MHAGARSCTWQTTTVRSVGRERGGTGGGGGEGQHTICCSRIEAQILHSADSQQIALCPSEAHTAHTEGRLIVVQL